MNNEIAKVVIITHTYAHRHLGPKEGAELELKVEACAGEPAFLENGTIKVRSDDTPGAQEGIGYMPISHREGGGIISTQFDPARGGNGFVGESSGKNIGPTGFEDIIWRQLRLPQGGKSQPLTPAHAGKIGVQIGKKYWRQAGCLRVTKVDLSPRKVAGVADCT